MKGDARGLAKLGESGVLDSEVTACGAYKSKKSYAEEVWVEEGGICSTRVLLARRENVHIWDILYTTLNLTYYEFPTSYSLD